MFESKTQRILYALIIAFFMSGFISLFMNLIDLGFNPNVIPLILILVPITKNIVLVISGNK
ncbi:conserved hypothetical protein [Abyssogena phaseoliformis symbiont OG214]|nr:conserved hypothetical protein [Abyssogena phaseoliformis symbiont OG214]